jgi:hypothetical protein
MFFLCGKIKHIFIFELSLINALFGFFRNTVKKLIYRRNFSASVKVPNWIDLRKWKRKIYINTQFVGD